MRNDGHGRGARSMEERMPSPATLRVRVATMAVALTLPLAAASNACVVPRSDGAVMSGVATPASAGAHLGRVPRQPARCRPELRAADGERASRKERNVLRDHLLGTSRLLAARDAGAQPLAGVRAAT
jgi:hypothetical protein